MLNFTLSAEPDNAEIALEALEHIKAAIKAIGRGAKSAVEKAVAPAAPETKPAEKVEEKPAEKAAAPEKKPAKKAPAKKTAKKKAGFEVGDIAGMDSDELLEECRRITTAAKDALGIQAIIQTMGSFEGSPRALSDLDDAQRNEYIETLAFQINDAAEAA